MKKNTENKFTTQVKDDEKNNGSTRRHFLKKVVYTAPSLVALGQLAKPSKAYADSGDVARNPDWGDGW